jgi:SanA protein
MSIPFAASTNVALGLAVAFAVVVLAGALGLVAVALVRRPRRRRVSSAARLPAHARPTLIVALGCPPRTRNGRPSRYLLGRAQAAAAAFHALPTIEVLCSGNGDDPGPDDETESDEVAALATLLEAAGVPSTAIRFHRGARRTIDTIDYLAAEHPMERILIVTQAFHLPRTLFLARAWGLDAWGLAAPGPALGWRGRLREGLGVVRAVWDVAVSRRGR